MKPCSHHPVRPEQGGFTLIELVGVLAILSLAGWAVVDGVWPHLRESIRRNESGRLGELGRALKRSVVHQRGIPGTTNWADGVALELAEPVTSVLRNGAGWNRRLVLDPAFRVGNPSAPPPYRQGLSGSVTPDSARAVLLSSVAADLPSLSSVHFQDLWDRSPGRLPRNWPSRWAGKPEDLLIERIPLEGLFHRICMNNLDSDVSAWVAVDGTNRWEIRPGDQVETFYFAETPLTFLDVRGEIQWAQSVCMPASFAFEGGRWRQGFSRGAAVTGSALASVYDGFVGSASTTWGVTPRHVASAVHEVLTAYIAWSEEGYPSETAIPGRRHPARLRVEAAAERLEEATGVLLGQPPDPQP